jgi:hypothetical protein
VPGQGAIATVDTHRRCRQHASPRHEDIEPGPLPERRDEIVAALKANPRLPGGFLVTGHVYDVNHGRIDVVVAPGLLRPENPA